MVVGDFGERKIRFLSETAPGSVHDKSLAERTALHFPSDSELHQDSGFQGYAPPEVQIFQPLKKKRGQERTDEERQHNRLISQIRIAVEHMLAGVKRARIVKERFRNTRSGFADLAMLLACGLHNLRQSFRRPSQSSYFG